MNAVITEAAEVEVFTRRDFVFAGRRWSYNTHTVYVIIHPINDDGTLSDKPWSFRYDKDWRKLSCGGVYRGAEFSETRMRGYQRATWERRWNGPELIVWQAKDEAAEAYDRSRKMEKDDRRISEIEKIMLPLRKQYAALLKKSDSAGRYALELAVARALTTLPRKSEVDDECHPI